MQREKINYLLKSDDFGRKIKISGWIRAERGNNYVRFIGLNDGSCLDHIQVVADVEKFEEALLKRFNVGAALSVVGTLKASEGKGQRIEIIADTIEVLGDADPDSYPIQPKKHSLEFLRENAHLRSRTNTFSAIFRVRHALTYAVHKYFHDNGFYAWHSPILTASDAEGAGEMFRVRNFLLEKKKLTFGKTTTWGGLSYQSPTSNQISAVYSNEFKGLFLNVEELIEKHFFNKHKHFFEGLVNFCKQEEQDRLINYETPKSLLWSSPTEIDALSEVWKKYEHTDKLTVAKEINAFFTSEQEKYILDLLGKSMKSNDTVNTINFINNIPITKLCFHNWIPSNLLDDNESVEFFGRKTHLTVSGQLEAELGALGLGKVYTFGPTFRAENSNTTRHLAEFWMIEPEMAFYEIEDNMDLAEDFLKYLIRFALENYADDLAFLDKRFTEENNAKKKEERAEQGLLEKLQSVIETDFVRISYTEAIDILLQSKPHKKGKFQYPVEWGIDLQSEHERFLVEKHFKKPVILSNYPRDIKAFYMKQNEGEEAGKETVRAMDVLCPGIGEIIGGSQREENYEKLKARTDAMGITDELWWYLDTRKFGTVPHSGFGLGFERLVLFVTGMSNIRDVIPFPRTPKNAEF